MTLFEAVSISISTIALLISIYTLYVNRKRGRLRVNFDIKMYQVKIDIINAGENPLVVTDIKVIVMIKGMSYFDISPKETPKLPVKVDRWGVIRLDGFKDSITTNLNMLFPKLNSLPAKISIYIETSQGDTYYRVNDQEIDLFKSVALANKAE